MRWATAVNLGAISFMTNYSISPAELALALEAGGYESFWAGDHSHIPVAPDVEGPILDTRTGEPLPVEYWNILDPFLALTSAAAATSTILLGTGICLVNERDPIATAKQVATLDHLSSGRFIFGIGGGWNEVEMRNHGTDPATRWQLLRERVQAMKSIWTDDVAEYEGELVRFGPMLAWPKPVQKPHPPIFLGGNRRNISRVLDYCDGWCPGTAKLDLPEVHEQVSELQQRAEAAGRGRLPVTAFHVTSVEELIPSSPLALTQERWDAHEEAGVDRIVVILPPRRDANLRMVDHYAKLIERSAA